MILENLCGELVDRRDLAKKWLNYEEAATFEAEVRTYA